MRTNVFLFCQIYAAIEDHGDFGQKVLLQKIHLHFIQ